MKIRGTIFTLLSVVVLIAIGTWFRGYLAVDKCLDNGGCWDEVEKVCRKDYKSHDSKPQLCLADKGGKADDEGNASLRNCGLHGN